MSPLLYLIVRVDGLTEGDQKCPLIFFRFEIYLALYRYELNYKSKMFQTNFMGLKFGQVGGLDEKTQNTLSVRFL